MKRLALTAAALALAALFSAPCFADAASGPVTCSDGTTSPHGGRGACSKHGGIKKDEAGASKEAAAAKPAATPATPAAPAKPAAAAEPAKPAAATASKAGESKSVNSDAAGATAKCKDGSYSHSKTHSGTCSKHGGVAEWLDGSGKK